MKLPARLLAVATLLLSFLALSTFPALAQGTIADYQRAMGLRERFTDLAVDVAGSPTWIEGTSSFWYRKSVVGGSEFMLVDASATEKGPAFDHARLAVVLSAALAR